MTISTKFRLYSKSALMGVATLMTLSSANAAVIAIIDSGSDLTHKDLVKKAWTNTRNDKDQGFPSDEHGWNFVDGNNSMVDLSKVASFSPDVYEFFNVQTRQLEGTETAADKKWLETHRADSKFVEQLNAFGDFAHGTHVAGVSGKFTDQAQLMSLRIIGEKAKPAVAHALKLFGFKVRADGSPLDNPTRIWGFQDRLIKAALDYLVSGEGDNQSQVGNFLVLHNPRVANCSFGTNTGTIQILVGAITFTLGGVHATMDDYARYYDYLMTKILKSESKGMIEPAKDTLFVIAAGNDGTDNDTYFQSPANVKADNTIAVAATMGRTKIASFSNYGATTVEVAAPGVGILSTSPGNKYVHMSGTSQATPYVTNTAGRILDENSKLSVVEVKRIIMGTVDIKAFLHDKVVTSGIVNPERAVLAAKLSNSMSVESAITQARHSVADLSDLVDLPSDSDKDSFISKVKSPYQL